MHVRKLVERVEVRQRVVLSTGARSLILWQPSTGKTFRRLAPGFREKSPGFEREVQVVVVGVGGAARP